MNTLFLVLEVLAALVFVGMGLFPFGYHFFKMAALRRSRYNDISAVVTKSEVSQTIETGHTHSYTGRMYSPKLEYEYRIGNETLRSNNIYYLGKSFSSSNKAAAENVVMKYPIGSTIVAKVHASKSGDVYVELRNPIEGFFFILGAIMIVVGLGIGYFALN